MSSRALELAGPAKSSAKSDSDSGNSVPSAEIVVEETRDELMMAVARLYGLGYSRTKVAKTLAQRLVPGTKVPQAYKAARDKLRRWEQDQKFRDLVWKHAVVKLDLSTPEILLGVAKSGKKGRVDAAKLALEVAGRHTSQANAAVTAVQVNIANGIARPS